MRFPRVRFTMRRMMVAVAVAALLIWSTSMAMRWAEYRRLALFHEELGLTLFHEKETFRAQWSGAKSNAARETLELDIATRERALAEEGAEARKYRNAMSRPWRRVAFPTGAN